ncbi:MAG: FAD-binding oxidoreductase [Anaerolineales bacterium]|nr:FAD-binding oxidoreductase [Anaerolineales bacterium]
MDKYSADVVICGAGIAGISAAYHLTVKHNIRDVVIIDERAPMSLTSDKSTECYRNWWPGPGNAMVAFMNRSIDLLEDLALESNNIFQMNRRGYVFLTADPNQAVQYKQISQEISTLGAGPLRVHQKKPVVPPYMPSPNEGFQRVPSGADLVLDADLIHAQFPFISNRAIAMLHPRRCGWLSAQQLGAYLLTNARSQGARLLRGKVTDVKTQGSRVSSVAVQGENLRFEVACDNFVIASGPFLKETAKMIGIELPVFNELHGKVAMGDPLKIIPRNAPLLLWSDPLNLTWSDSERRELAADPQTHWMTEQMPSGIHFRPEGGEDSPILLMLWTYDLTPREPIWPPVFDHFYPEVVLRGLITMVPGLTAYLDRMPKPYVDGGYYCKTKENRPLIGPLPVEGAFLFGALSGFGIMAAMAGGELLAAHLTGSNLPDYAEAFLLSRYQDPAYQALLDDWDVTSGQL